MRRTGVLIGLLLLVLSGCGSDRYAGADGTPAYLVHVSTETARGSGVLYQADDAYLYVLTAAHVAGPENSGQVTVRFFDGWEIACEDVAVSRTADIALIRIPKEQIPGQLASYQCVAWDKGSFDGLQAGDICAAVGLEPETGLVRHEGNILETWIYMEDYGQYMIWADVTVEPGMSGGALLDEEGRLVGILSGGSEDGELAAVPLSLVWQFMLEYELGTIAQ